MSICKTEAYSDVIYVAKDVEGTLLSAEELINKVFTNQTIDDISFIRLPVSILKGDNADKANDYIKKFTLNSYSLIKQLPVLKLETEFERQVLHIIKIRNKLMEAGGYVNFCLAGSLTSSINVLFIERIIQSGIVKENILKEDRLSIRDIVGVIELSDRFENKSSFIDFEDVKSQENDTDLMINLFKQKKKDIHYKLTFNDWAKLDPNAKFHFGFDRDMLRENSFSVIFYNWIFLLDQQFAIRVLFSELSKDSHLLTYSKKQIKEKLDAAVRLDTDAIVYTTFKSWNGRRVYDFVRKYKGGITGENQSRFDVLLKRSLLEY
jgi:hypothetical protein